MNWKRFFRREQADAEQQRELESYLEITTDEYMARGMEEAAARAAARRKLGNSTLVREEVYFMNTIRCFDLLGAAFRYWFRTLRREPMFAITAILTLAPGICGQRCLVDAALIQSLPSVDTLILGEVVWLARAGNT